jgi:uroporphyrinogen decarboxylase
MNPIERVQCVLAGRPPDRPPLSFWHHFSPDEFCGPAAVQAHVSHLETYDLDFLKVMNDNGYPHTGLVRKVGDLSSVSELRGDEPEFARQLDLIADLRRKLDGNVLMTTTIFNAWMVLRHLIRPPTEHNPPDLSGAPDEPSEQIKAMLMQDDEAVKSAIGRIGLNLSRFARRCVEAGAGGIFLSVRDDWLQSAVADLYSRVVRSSDLEILRGAAGGRFNLLHVCGRAVHFQAFAAYPVHAINWADRSAGPSIADVKGWLKPAICGGIDNLVTLPNRSADDCESEVADALRQAGQRPIMLAPGCTYDPHRVPRANLKALCRATNRSRHG